MKSKENVGFYYYNRHISIFNNIRVLQLYYSPYQI